MSEYVSCAFHVACSGRPGPVVLGLPEDMLSAECHAHDAKVVLGGDAQQCPHPAQVQLLSDKLRQAARPRSRRSGLERRGATGC